MLCYEDGANECETKNWLELKIEGKFWGATVRPFVSRKAEIGCTPF